jgi:hypothetical protein
MHACLMQHVTMQVHMQLHVHLHVTMKLSMALHHNVKLDCLGWSCTFMHAAN